MLKQQTAYFEEPLVPELPLIEPDGDMELLEEPEGDIELLEEPEDGIELEEPEGDMELLEEPEDGIEPVDELEGEVVLGEVEEGVFKLEPEDPDDAGRVVLEGVEHAPKAKADAITKGNASDFNFIDNKSFKGK